MRADQLQIKLYADGANIDSMLALNKNDMIKGFTTNPTLMSKAGITDYRSFAKEVLKHISKPISFEVFSDDLDEMKEQALEISSWGDNVYVKIPVTNTKSELTSTIIHDLSHSGVKVNVTCLFTIHQVYLTSLVLKGGAPSIVSVFAGRIADAGVNPVDIMSSALNICKSNDPNIELLWASPRELYNIVEANNVGCDIITVAPEILNKLSLLGKDLMEFSLDTVKMFYNDAVKSKFSL